jgi:hypothetical protein
MKFELIIAGGYKPGTNVPCISVDLVDRSKNDIPERGVV